jgi:hypothetical protein
MLIARGSAVILNSPNRVGRAVVTKLVGRDVALATIAGRRPGGATGGAHQRFLLAGTLPNRRLQLPGIPVLELREWRPPGLAHGLYFTKDPITAAFNLRRRTNCVATAAEFVNDLVRQPFSR